MSPELLMSLCVGGAVASLAWAVASVVAAHTVSPELGRFEEGRREQLRATSVTYRWAEPWIDEIVASLPRCCSKLIGLLQRDLPATGNRTPWRPVEYLATRQVESLLAGVGMLLLGLAVWPPTQALAAAVAAAGLCLFLLLSGVKKLAQKRRGMIRRRFTSAFDLVSLMLAVGSTFPEAVGAVADQSKGHPLGDELDRMLQDTHMGRLRGDALRAFSDRLADQDIGEMMASIVEAEELGTPIAETMQTQVDQMRLKRTQWAEKTSEEATVKLVFPLMINVLACLIIVASPFLLDYVLQS